MPIYEYRCENGHTFEVLQRMSDPPVTACEVDGGSVERVFNPIAVHFKGSGFYATDYGKRKAGANGGGDGGGESKSSDSGSSDSSSSSESKSADSSKPAASSTAD
jgi:putative FmdB family regulatory protein